MRISRRELLLTLGMFGTAASFPGSVVTAPLLPERLRTQAEALAHRARSVSPSEALQAACSLIHDAEALCAVAPRTYLRRSLHRTAAVASITAGQTARWAGSEYRPYLARAVGHAQAADDAVLVARTDLHSARAEGSMPHGEDAPSTEVLRLLRKALSTMGASPSAASLRATALYMLAWQYAAQGDERSALTELDSADRELSCSRPTLDAQSEAASRRASIHRRLGRYHDAEAHLSDALSGPPVRTTAVLCDIARMRVGQREVDMAATALEEAWLLNWSAGLAGRQHMVLSVRRTLPDSASVRQLDAVMGS